MRFLYVVCGSQEVARNSYMELTGNRPRIGRCSKLDSPAQVARAFAGIAVGEEDVVLVSSYLEGVIDPDLIIRLTLRHAADARWLWEDDELGWAPASLVDDICSEHA